jgi:signal transduction histidine kinase
MMRLRAEQKRIALLVEAPAGPLYVSGDAVKLRQILVNLVGNALAFTERGSVTLRWNTRPADEPERVVLLVEVEDTGIGIAAEDQARIFDAFVQVGQVGRRKGTGLGLSSARAACGCVRGEGAGCPAPGRHRTGGGPGGVPGADCGGRA